MKTAGFSKQDRLLTKQDFSDVFQRGRKKEFKFCLALVVKTQAPVARLGILISKKQIKLAVQRNRVRRLVRESFRHHKQQLKGLDIVLQMRSECAQTEAKLLRSKLDTLWQAFHP